MIPIYKPYLKGNEKKYVNQCIDSTWISSKGKFLELFEKAIIDFTGVKYASSCCNGSVALDLAFKAIGLKKEDEVITASFTYVASTNSILINNGTPVFIDIESESWNIDAKLIEAKINKKTKAILISNIYGFLPEIEKIRKLCDKYKIFLIEDAAESLGANYAGLKSGNIGDISTFSFFGNKTITSGEGGMVMCNDENLYLKIEQLKNQGNNKEIRYYHDILGFNYRMTNIQAAIGLAQTEQLKKILQKKKELFSYYFETLNKYVEFQRPINEAIEPSYWIVCVLFKTESQKQKIIRAFDKSGIEFRPLFTPVDKFPFYENNNNLKVSNNIYNRGICLPSFPELSKNELNKICNTIINNL